MKLKKQLIMYIAILSIFISNTCFAIKLTYDGKEHEYTAEPIKLMINQKILNTDMPPVVIDGRTLVPVRAVLEQIGATVLWVPESGEIFITQESNIILLKVNSNIANINGELKTMEVSPKIINNSTMIPLRFIGEELNFKIGWDEKNRIASIDSKSSNENSSSNPNDINKPDSDNLQGKNGEIIKFKATSKPNTNVSKPITSENNNTVNIISIDVPKTNEELFTITANGRISSVKHGILENPPRLYIDIENSISKLNPTISKGESKIVNSIRTAQQENNITRVVFDISAKEDYDIYLSEDRTSINVKFKAVSLSEITFQSIGGQDIVNIYSSGTVTPIITKFTNPKKFIIDIPVSNSAIGLESANVLGTVTSNIKVSQFDESTFRITLDLTQSATYEMNVTSTCTTIKFKQPTYKNMAYENDSSPRLVLKKDNILNINSFIHTDKYSEGYYKITIPNDYSNLYGYGEYKINDKYINSIEIQTVNGKTEFKFNQQVIHTYTITEDAQNIYINILNPKQIYKKIVFLDPGHGGEDGGNTHNNITEKVVNLDVSNRLYLLLDADPNIKVYATRTTDVYVTRPQRAIMANSIADLFVSIHCNSIETTISNYESISGVQVFYPNPSDNRGTMSKEISNIFRETLSSKLGIPNRPADQTLGYEYTVLSKTNMPACLIELGFLTNLTDVQKLATAEGRQAAAEAIYEGIKQSFTKVIPSR